MRNFSFIALLTLGSLLTASGFPSLNKRHTHTEDDEGSILTAFEASDTNKDGYVSSGEVAAFLGQLGVKSQDQANEVTLLTYILANEIIQTFDKDHDKLLDRPEFRLYNKHGSSCSMFMVIDADKDGFLSREESSSFLKKWGIADGSIYMKIMDDYDGNDDGQWDWDEFVEYHAAMKQNKKWMRDEFKGLDKDGNGLISTDEYKTATNAVGLSLWAAMSDFDEDGGLNFQEYVLAVEG